MTVTAQPRQPGTRLRYSRWDGSGDPPLPAADRIFSGLTDDLMMHGDLEQALRNYLQRGGDGAMGLDEMLATLRARRRQQLQRYRVDDIMSGLAERLHRIERSERKAIAAMAAPTDDLIGNPPPTDHAPPFARTLMSDIAATHEAFFDTLPDSPPARLRALQDYEFLSPEAQRDFEALLDELRQAVTATFFRDVASMAQSLGSDDLAHMAELVDALNAMLERQIGGREPDFEGFMERFGDRFGPNPPASLEALLAQLQGQMAALRSLLMSMPTDQFAELAQLLSDRMGNPHLDHGLRQLTQKLDFLYSGNPAPQAFHGTTSMDLRAALDLLRELQDNDDLQRQLERSRAGDPLDAIDLDKLQDLLGPEAADAVRQMKQVPRVLEAAGHIRQQGGHWAITPRGTRRLGQAALGEIYRHLQRHSPGRHQTRDPGRFGNRSDDTRPWEFGEPLHLDLPRTLRNAIRRNGPGTPLGLRPEDFEVYRSETMTRTTTVMMLDLSWSMALRGAFVPAKKVAMALNDLIAAQFPQDQFYLVGFSAYARELKPHELPSVQCDEYMLGTNVQHALAIAERLLAKHPGGTRQILMITDGEPTAHLRAGRAQFSYPPSPITIAETLRAAQRCTRRNITINTFMLEQSPDLKAFVDRLTRINKGRLFHTTPENLGAYILVDYVEHKRRISAVHR